MDCCAISQEVKQTGEYLVEVGKKGVNRIKDAARLRSDTELLNKIEFREKLSVHAECRRNYTDKRRIKKHNEDK